MNVKSLAAEARIIRHEVNRLPKTDAGRQAASLISDHRRQEVRREARSAHLAYAFLRGTPYQAVEKAPRTPPNAKRVASKIERWRAFGEPSVAAQDVESWING